MRFYIFIIIILFFVSCSDVTDQPVFNQSEFKDYTNITLNSSLEVVDEPLQYQPRLNRTIAVSSQYVDSFTASKVNNPIIFDYLKTIYSRYDIVLLQGIEDIDVVSRLAGPLDKKYIVSERVGEGFDTYYYAYLYDRGITLVKSYIYDTENIVYKPYIAIFNIGEYDFALVNVMTNKFDAQEEISELNNVVSDITKTYDLNDVFIMGNLYADCEYYTKGLYLTEYNWLITAPTDAKFSGCTYSNIISANKNSVVIKNSGVDTYEYLSFTDDSLKKVVSKEFPVWMELKI